MAALVSRRWKTRQCRVVQAIMGAIQNLNLLKSLIFQSYQRISQPDHSLYFISLLAFSPHFGAYLRQSRKQEGQVVVGTINARRRSDGTTAYSAQILLMRAGQIVHRESKTFNDRAMAKGWIERRERELAKPGGLEAAKIGKETLADAIDKYIATSRKKIGNTKAQVLDQGHGHRREAMPPHRQRDAD